MCLIKLNTGLKYDATFIVLAIYIRRIKPFIQTVIFVYVCGNFIYYNKETEAIQIDFRRYIVNCTVIQRKRKTVGGKIETDKFIDAVNLR